jgi:hypothetical protein
MSDQAATRFSPDGQRRTNEDKRRAVTMLLDDVEWSSNSNAWIAEAAAVNIRTVERIKAERRPVTTDIVGSDEGRSVAYRNKHGTVSRCALRTSGVVNPREGSGVALTR